VTAPSRLIGIFIIVFGASCAWTILGETLVTRTSDSDTEQRAALGGLWGSEQTQLPAKFHLDRDATVVTGKTRTLVTTTSDLNPERTDIRVNLALDQRQKGLLWYNTYVVGFDSNYDIHNDGRVARLRIVLPFAAQQATYDDVVISFNGRPLGTSAGSEGLLAAAVLQAGGTAVVRIAYTSHGLGTWTYRLSSDMADVRNFVLKMTTNFTQIDFPPQTLAPTYERRAHTGWELTWRYGHLIAGYGIGMAFPQILQPGPLAQRITFWAPVSLLFYVFVLLVVTTLRGIDLHPINYFFLAAAFFAFHLLFAYTVDRIPVGLAFAICSVVSMFLTITYLRLVVNLRFAAVEAAAAQFFYLVLFSLALFNEGYSGLSITIGAIVTLFATMQWTGRIRWSERAATVRGYTC